MFGLQSFRLSPAAALFAAAAVALVACLALCCAASTAEAGIAAAAAAAGLAGAGMAYGVADAALTVSKALPNGAASVTSDGIDLGHGTHGDFLADCEFKLTAPALSTTELPDTKTMTYILQHDTDSAFGTAATLVDNAIVQTGASSAGAAAATWQGKLPAGVNRYVRFKATNSGTGNASGSTGTLDVLFGARG